MFVIIMLIATEMHSQINEPDSLIGINELSKMSLDELLQISVTTGSFVDTDLKNSASAITIITAAQIEASGARHISEALEIFVPGFQSMINKWNGIIWGMRGVASDRNTKFIFLVNGHKMNTESRDGAMTELDLGLLEDVERIEVLRGPAGLTYGSGAIAGVVNVVTKKDDKRGGSVSAKVQTWQMDTYGEGVQLNFSDRLAKHAKIRFDLGMRKSEGVGIERSRIYGRPSWPSEPESPSPPENGVPSAGSAGSTPGNYKIGADFSFKNFHLYTRWTHQATNASGWYAVDPWPGLEAVPDSTFPTSIVDGKTIDWKSYYATSESWGHNRRQYVLENISLQADYKIQVLNNELKFKAAFDGLTNRIQLEDLKGYKQFDASDRNTLMLETFGERRYNLGAIYSLKKRKRYNIAAGYELSVYDIGKDMSGLNAQRENNLHSIVTDVVYVNNAFYTEGLINVTEKLETQIGLRYDLHTRTKIHGGIFNPKVGLIYHLNDAHSLKLFYQQSANNGSADNYEFNRFLIGDDGEPFAGEDYHFAFSYIPQDIIPPVTEEILHQLKPERSRSYELSSTSQFANIILVSPAFSYNTISDLFAWNQELFRVVNTWQYSFVNLDFDIQLITNDVNLGLNHTYQRVVNMDLKAKEEYVEMPVFAGYDSTLVGTIWHYTPVRAKTVDGKDSSNWVTYNYIRDGITVDEVNFLSLSPHVTKLFIDYKPARWLTLHLSARVYWALSGRKDIHEYKAGENEVLDVFAGTLKYADRYNDFDMHKKPIIKMNAGFVIAKPKGNITCSFHVYDILGGNGDKPSIHSLRWSQMFDASIATGLYAQDYRSYALKLRYKF